MSYEFDDLDLELIEKCRTGVEYLNDGAPLKDALEEDDIEYAIRLIVDIAESLASVNSESMKNELVAGVAANARNDTPTGWQPIETAPKDQTPIDIWANGRRMPNMSRFGVDNKDVYFDATTSECVFIVVVTHWMPLPTPPQGEPL